MKNLILAATAVLVMSCSAASAHTSTPTPTPTNPSTNTNVNNNNINVLSNNTTQSSANASLQALINAGGGKATASSLANGGNASANGGAGGAGGNGGSASVGNVTGGTSNSNASGGNATGGNSSSSANGGNSTANGGTASANGGASNAQGGQGVGNVTTTVTTENKPAAAQAYAASLTASNDTCMGSTSGGAQAVGFGLSLGSTYTDDDCVRRKDATFLYNIGQGDAAIALMCQKKETQDAILKAGNPQLARLCSGSAKSTDTGSDRQVLNTPADRSGTSNGFNE